MNSGFFSVAKVLSPNLLNLMAAKENIMPNKSANDRRLIRIEGDDAKPFLQNLITNDIGKLASGLIYSALLTPQGKFMADFFVVSLGGKLLIDVDEKLADSLMGRLSLYKMRADIRIEFVDIQVTRGIGEVPSGAFADPRHSSLGWRIYGASECDRDHVDWDAIRVVHCIPESCIELIPNSTFILEAGFDRLNGVDFNKGCYVGQEVTARMKHKTKLRKGLSTVEIQGSAETGEPILADGREVGRIYTVSGNLAIAYLRFDRLGASQLSTSAARVSLPPTFARN